MQMTRDIVRDLLPAYLSGEASKDSRAVVEEWLAHDPALREIAEAAGADAAPPALDLPAELEHRSLQRTRRLLAAKSRWLAAALVLSGAPAILRPLWAADLTMAAGLAAWVVFLAICRRLSATGLEPSRRWSTRFAWAFAGSLVGLAAAYLYQRHHVDPRWSAGFPCVFCGVALWIGEKFHQVPEAGELSRPITLFGK